MKLFCFPRSGNSREVKIALAEKGISYEAVDIHSNKAAAESEEFKKASPQRKVPAIIDGDVYLSEAFMINQYLDTKYPNPPLMPKDAALQAEIKRFIAEIDKTMVLNIGLLVIECILKKKEEQREDFKEKKRREVYDALKELDKRLQGKSYLFGDFSLADIAVTPHIAALPILGAGIPEDLHNVREWFRRIQERPSFKQSLQ